jgi:hypothetical protein
MANGYNKILRQAGLKISAIKGATVAAVETNYVVNPLTTTQWQSIDFPLQSVKDMMIGIVGDLVSTYANVENHAFRAHNLSQTASIAKGGLIPSVNSAGKSIVGLRGAIRDATTSKVLTEETLQKIERLNRNQDSFFKGVYYYYKLIADRIEHTRTNVVIDVCWFDAATEEALITANGNPSIPDALYDAVVSGLVSKLVKDEEFTAQASLHSNYYENVKAGLRNGATTFPAAPTLVNSKAPAVS